MESKLISKSLFALFAVVFLVSFVSATVTLNTPNPITLDSGTTTVDVTNDDPNNTITLSIAAIGEAIFSLSETTITGLTGSQAITITATGISFDAGLDFGSVSTTFTADDGVSPVTTKVEVIKTFCSNGPAGNDLEIRDIQWESDGDDDDEWKLLDKITIEVEVENNNRTDDVDDVFVEIGLIDSSGKNVIRDFDFFNRDDEEIDLGDIRDDDKETAIFEFQIPADFDIDSSNYKLVVKAYGDKLGQDVECTDSASDFSGKNDLFEEIDIDMQDDEGKFIAFDDIRVNPSEVSCGEIVTLITDVVNIGDEDQDQVRINLKNSELDLNLFREIRNDLDEGDDETVEFTFTVPEVADKTYILELDSLYDYRNGVYREKSDDREPVELKVIGCSLPSGQGIDSSRVAAISASLDSDAKAGEVLIVTSSITNLGNSRADFLIDVSGFNSWSSIDSISSRILSLDAGETREVTLSFNVDEDASDRESFTIEVRSGDKVETRQVSVNIDSISSAGFSFGDNTLIWVIGIINLVLIILIIVVAVRLSRR